MAKPKELSAKEYEKLLGYFEQDELAASTWLKKYALRNKEGRLIEKHPDQMFRRLAREFARIESSYAGGDKANHSAYGKKREALDEEKIFSLFSHFRYLIPQGSVLAGLGNPYQYLSLSNCVVLPEIPDSYGGILRADEQLVQLYKRRCGVGLDLSTLRPKGSRVQNAAGSTSGAVSFMERFSNTTREVAQQGRRGALMLTLDIRHPEIREFIHIKQNLQKITGANISVRLTDEFMQAVMQNKPFELRWPIEAEKPRIRKSISASALWKEIIACAHQTAEPGLIFWDHQHYYSTSSLYPAFHNVSTNPCSEIAMQGGDSCRLMALNLYHFVKNPFSPEAEFDLKQFYAYTYEAQRLMDDLVDLELEAIERILKKVVSDPEPQEVKRVELETWQLLYENGKEGRRTGLGFTALADTIASLGLKFDSKKAGKMIEKIMRTKCEAEFDASIDLAIERGAFKGFDPKIEEGSAFVQMLRKEFPGLYQRMIQFGRRNISISTVAPTGTISLLARTSSGIEPVFMLDYTRRRKLDPDTDKSPSYVDEMGDKWEEFKVFHPKLKDWMKISGETDANKSPYAGATAQEIDWHQRIKIQSIVQKYTTHSISSTVNLPANVRPETVGEIYEKAWQEGLKGITVYREGARSGVLVSEPQNKKTRPFLETHAPQRPKKLKASVIRFTNEKEKWIAVVGLLEDKPYEIFTGKAEDTFHLPPWVTSGWVLKNRMKDHKARYDFQYVDKEGYKTTIEGLSRSFDQEYWNYAKLISAMLRHGMPLQKVIEMVEDLSLYSENINTWKTGVARALRKFIPSGTMSEESCPSCMTTNSLVYEEGCLKCQNCGYQACG